MKILFWKAGKAKDVFRELARQAYLEHRFGRLIELLEPVDFYWN